MSEEKKKGECCPDCFHKERYSGDKGIVDVCENPECPCHHPLGVEVGDETKATATFGKP
jgi:hypothetical protein